MNLKDDLKNDFKNEAEARNISVNELAVWGAFKTRVMLSHAMIKQITRLSEKKTKLGNSVTVVATIAKFMDIQCRR